MKLLRETIRRLLLESEETDYVSQLLDMAGSSFGHFHQAKELASTLELDVDLEMEFLKVIKQEIDQLLVNLGLMDAKKHPTFYTKIIDREWYTEFEPFKRGITMGYEEQPENKTSYGSVFLGEDVIKMKWEKGHWSRRQDLFEFNSVADLIAHLNEQL